jgi:hypothetical protein
VVALAVPVRKLPSRKQNSGENKPLIAYTFKIAKRHVEYISAPNVTGDSQQLATPPAGEHIEKIYASHQRAKA